MVSSIPRPYDAGAPNLSTSAPSATETLLTPARIDLPRSGGPTRTPLPLRPDGRLLVPNWDQGGGTLAVPAGLAHPSLAPEAAPSLPTGQYLVRFQLCSVAYERHVPPPPAAAQNPSRELTAHSVSPLRAQPRASEWGLG